MPALGCVLRNGWNPLGISVAPAAGMSLRHRRCVMRPTHGQLRSHWHSAALQKFFTHRTHKKFCSRCGKPCALLLEVCNFCGELLLDEHIGPTGRDPIVECLLGPVAREGMFNELHRSFDTLVLEHRYPVGRLHLLAVPKSTFYDVRQLRRRHVKLLRALYTRGVECVKEQLQLPGRANPTANLVCGFSYPADYNQLYLHLVVPPFSSLALFDRRVFLPYGQVDQELDTRGVLRGNSQIFNPEADDALLARLLAMDQASRDALASEPNAKQLR